VMAKLNHGSLVVLVPEAPITLIGMVGKPPLTAFHLSRWWCSPWLVSAPRLRSWARWVVGHPQERFDISRLGTGKTGFAAVKGRGGV
jgi:hypothetical protein